MPVKTHGRNDGSFSEGGFDPSTCSGGSRLTREQSRPYLHIYQHSNELEELGIVSLDAVNVESDPQKEILLGVRHIFVQILTDVLSLCSNVSHSLCSLPLTRMPLLPPISRS